MPVSKAQQKAVNKYMSQNYDRINLTVPKGQKEIIKAHAEAHSESVNGFINRAIEETMERDKAAPGASRLWRGTKPLLGLLVSQQRANKKGEPPGVGSSPIVTLS